MKRSGPSVIVAPHKLAHGKAKAGLAYILATVTMNSLSFGILLPVLPSLIKRFTTGDTAAAAEWLAAFATVWGVMQFLASPALGLLSDRYGRRPIMLLSSLGLFIDYMIMAFAPSITWLFLGRILTGLSSSSGPTANAYVADITLPERRARNFGIVAAALNAGFLLGPVLGGYLAEVNLRLPFIVAASLALTNFIYGVVILPESLSPDRRAVKFEFGKANAIGSAQLLWSRPALMRLGAMAFLFQLANTVWASIFVLYAGHRFHWEPGPIGLSMMAMSAVVIFVQLRLVGPLAKAIGERGLMIVGALAGVIGYTVAGLAPDGWIYLITIPAIAMASVFQPGIRGLMTRCVQPDEQGQLQGAMQSLQSGASILGPLMYGLAFAWTLRHGVTGVASGTSILVGAFIMTIDLALALSLFRNRATSGGSEKANAAVDVDHSAAVDIKR
jgi:MFS transporter, DHA1 family, tetracycline resistance protein